MSTDSSLTAEGDVPIDHLPSEPRDEDGLLLAALIDRFPVSEVRIDSLVLEDSPRLSGENLEHIRLLAEINGILPPITVHRPTMRVIDGVHRVRAALLKGEDTIEARLCDCNDDDAFVLAVQVNIIHGLPLSLADRKAAAVRIIISHPTWSDRVISASTGLSDKTISVIRRCSTSEVSQSNERIGRDGRARPLDSTSKRHHAAELIKARPDAGLREVARETGLSLSTVSNVRKRMLRDEDPVPRRYRDATQRVPLTASEENIPANGKRAPDISKENRYSILETLQNDPFMKFSESGRCILRRFHQDMIETEDWEKVITAVPAHCAN
jgi:ParB-like chromosome segregation protein Spo0J